MQTTTTTLYVWPLWHTPRNSIGSRHILLPLLNTDTQRVTVEITFAVERRFRSLPSCYPHSQPFHFSTPTFIINICAFTLSFLSPSHPSHANAATNEIPLHGPKAQIGRQCAPKHHPTSQNRPRRLFRQPGWNQQRRQRRPTLDQHTGQPGDHARRRHAWVRLSSFVGHEGALRRPTRPALQSRRVDARSQATRRTHHRGRFRCGRRVPRRRARPHAAYRLAPNSPRNPAGWRPRFSAAERARGCPQREREWEWICA